MGDAVWFFHHAGSRLGPMTWSELKENATSGDLDPDDLVWQPEMADWEPAGTIKDLFETPKPSEGRAKKQASEDSPAGIWSASAAKRDTPSVAPHHRPVEASVRALARALPAPKLDALDRVLEWVAQGAYLGASLLAVVSLVVVGIREPAPILIVIALAVLPAALLLSYFAARFLVAIRTRLDASSIRLSSSNPFRGLAVLALSLSVLGLAVGLGMTIAGSGVMPLFTGLGLGFVCIYAAAALLDTNALGVKVQKGTSDCEEMAGSLQVLVRLVFLRLTPAVFSIAALAGLVAAVAVLLLSVGEGSLPVLLSAAVSGRVLSVALLPFAAWFIFLMLWLPIGVVQSLIGTGDGVTRRKESGGE